MLLRGRFSLRGGATNVNLWGKIEKIHQRPQNICPQIIHGNGNQPCPSAKIPVRRTTLQKYRGSISHLRLPDAVTGEERRPGRRIQSDPIRRKEIRRLSEDSGNVMRSGELSDAAICGSVCRDGPKPGYWCGSHAGVPDRYTAGMQSLYRKQGSGKCAACHTAKADADRTKPDFTVNLPTGGGQPAKNGALRLCRRKYQHGSGADCLSERGFPGR